ncbi:16S rRNA (cytosine(1402)-N(4))-methyltransferase RsmH [Dehalogenimonas sp. THU2]|uniref:16S rRNA (cytosine(1402)-N(4))-methyltransferase RsmH n=1 Tax=Dehalogenimonas sp. THU2 TaxID=3151121 RepID=UPI00321883FD
MSSDHIPVMLEETLQALAVGPGGRYVDGTTGAGGHARAILEMSSPGGQLLGIDADPKSLEIARENLWDFEGSYLLVNDNFGNMETVCRDNGFYPVHGILLDLGLASMQLTAAGRGFSFRHEAPLDMRFSPDQKVTAAEIVNTYSETEISDILWRYGEERRSRQIARRIVESRPIKTTTELAALVARVVGGGEDIHPATRTFQALRIAVNEELTRLENVLEQATRLLGFGGRLVVISYHSLEDRIVKQFMQQESRDCVCPADLPECRCGHAARLRILNKKVITPSVEELRLNPRSRSAKLRAAERILSREENEVPLEELFFLNESNQPLVRNCLEAGSPTLVAPGVTPLRRRAAM